MSTLARQVRHTYAEYLDALAISELRLEYLDGEIFAMAGGTPEHGMIAARMIQLLGAMLPKRCRVLTSDVKIRVAATGLSTFPDVSVVCGELERAPDDRNAIINPVVLIEVLSPSTEQYDQGEKLRHYQQLSSLQTVLFIAHDEQRVTVVQRTPTGWSRSDHRDRVELGSLGALTISELYA